ncbi:hypothetical protein BAUCODRAFT_37206 [Baudoinia panamericana UAMH 10762]|uniref:DUF2415 domain-containing protein n=1 Tax=Baudoinia panamericana (strain UAMH 10762) TaxID=717646 RepID=M2N4B0_BAUPA|nr:uncharacterized protein BAUCODRAFT_37206 [Baudoinia panamericana UAMH 10762]EMC93520.1 hypothetical protein BAUCODRAFT_37206 [Baudoinia panamericana UAMH 10762]
MAIDTIPYPDATDLAHAKKGFYAVKIPVSHWQLRHYISSPEPELLYYASANDIYCLNTNTKKRKHIATLPFEARCTASGYGYVCVGGEDDGHFAAIKLDGSRAGAMEVDTALPVEPWRQVGNGAGRRAASVKVERIGEEIVNSISIHRIQDEEAHLDDIVAVLTNNDKTVRVYSLPQGLETTVLDLPFAMNHATISPDGHTLVAVGDFNQAYFFQREIQETPPQIPKPHNRLTSASIEWTLTSVVSLHGTEHTLGYFTTAWSPSGRLVAVGSESGFLTVFDMSILMSPDYDDEDAVVAVIPSSRADQPPPHPGAVRSMLFAPDPWDLLIWAEDQGRICIGDLRTGLKTKQIVNLEPKEEGLDKLVFDDVPAERVPTYVPVHTRDMDELEADFIRRYRQAPDNASAVNFATEYIEARRRQRQQRQDMAALRSQANLVGVSALEDDPAGLTAREQQILESLRTSRQREEARAAGQANRTVNYTSPEMFSGSRTFNPGIPQILPASSGSTSAARPISEILSSVPDSFPELSRTSAASPRPSSSHYTEQAQPPPYGAGYYAGASSTRLSEPSRLPRRRASVVLSPPATNSSSASSSTLASLRPGVPPLATPEPEDENPWRTIEEHMTLARGPLFESAHRAQAASPVPASARPTEQELAAELAAERARARSLARQRERFRSLRAEAAATDALRTSATTTETVRRIAGFPEGYEALVRRSQMRGYSGREVGVRTAGLAISPDGRTLWAACEDGIFEISLNLKARMFWPSLEPV